MLVVEGILGHEHVDQCLDELHGFDRECLERFQKTIDQIVEIARNPRLTSKLLGTAFERHQPVVDVLLMVIRCLKVRRGSLNE